MDIEIERIRAEHIEGFHRALDGVARERKYLAFLEAPPLQHTREFVMNNIQNDFPQFVALSRDEVIGWCDVLPKQRPVQTHSGVLGMGLLPAWRGSGIGRRLITRTLDAARDFGLTRVELTVHSDNGRAIALYKSVGFVEEGLLRDAIRIGGVYGDSILMARLERIAEASP